MHQVFKGVLPSAAELNNHCACARLWCRKQILCHLHVWFSFCYFDAWFALCLRWDGLLWTSTLSFRERVLTISFTNVWAHLLFFNRTTSKNFVHPLNIFRINFFQVKTLEIGKCLGFKWLPLFFCKFSWILNLACLILGCRPNACDVAFCYSALLPSAQKLTCTLEWYLNMGSYWAVIY